MDDAFQSFARQCTAELQTKQERIAEILAFDNEIDFERGVVRFVAGDDLFMEADVTAIGSRGLKSGTWLWAWANPSIKAQADNPIATLAKIDLASLDLASPDLASPDLAGLKEFAAESAIPATEQQVWEFAAIACRQAKGIGVFRRGFNGSDWFFVITRLTRHRPEAEIIDQAQLAAARSLIEARGPGLLNTLRKRFADLRINLMDADLRGPAQPWAHDLHVQLLFEQGYIMQESLREAPPQEKIQLAPYMTSHRTNDLGGANLSLARLDGAILRGATLLGANLEHASLVDADLSRADLRDVSLRSTFLNGANLTGAALAGADLTGAELSRTLLADVDLSKVKGLDDVHHQGPSEISMSTLIASNFEIAPAFLRKAGVSRGLIQDLMRGKRLAGAYQTCFLSYSSKDGDFAGRLYSSLTRAGVRVFWDVFDMMPGESLDAQILEAIRESKRLVVVLSEHSMASTWVAREIQHAWTHRHESLLPVRLCAIDDIKHWTASRKDLPDLANELAIEDFSGWRDPQLYNRAISRMLVTLAGGVDLRRTRRTARHSSAS